MSELSHQQALHVFVGAFIDELVRAGVRNFCVCPGSRSTPLALLLVQHPAARVWIHLDERSAGFFGLGIAKARREPVALVCTSGTAAANFFPAVVEARYARVPLLVLTADRPHELRDRGAPQTIDQINLYGSHAKWFVDLPVPQATPELVRYVRTVASRAAATASAAPAGPVQINCPYREPLVPRPPDDLAGWNMRPDQRPYLAVTAGVRMPDPAQIQVLAGELADVRRGLIVCGAQDDPHLAAAVTRLARALNFPILADPLSGLRCGPHEHTLILDLYDGLLRNNAFVARYAPEVVLRFGAFPTSKALLLYLQRYPDCRQIVIDGAGGWNEPTNLADQMIHADARQVCDALTSALSEPGAHAAERSAWTKAWMTADCRARAAVTERLRTLEEPFEGKVFAELAELLPDGATLWAGSSMPVRDLDTFFPGSERTIRMLSNRGANGIDGVVSSALGASTAGAGPLLLVIGDISFYHDANGLLAAKQHNLNATIVLLNNDGGGIFSFLPQATTTDPAQFELLFGTPHGLDFRPLAEMYGARFTRVKTWAAFRAAVQNGLTHAGLDIIEVLTRRDRNVTLHRELWQVVDAALAELT
jgi:2-succinyl-5-enolpyruvyl-6-hydroxy-3-cyclohexene-1-carboxylate synthase